MSLLRSQKYLIWFSDFNVKRWIEHSDLLPIDTFDYFDPNAPSSMNKCS